MLSEREQDTLLEIQRRLAADDPDFERSFRALDEVAPAARPTRPRISSVIIALAAGFAVLVLLAGSPVGALPYAVIATLVWLVRDLPDTAARHERRE
ncbi:DUF3040 domain-containing protein [Saccharothrix longispora]|uniref:DUF3040 domain-containing protein n=1 Tax=Saccharothrix longispora TaxID=33920 RepID=UPI0028FD1375|nr:DUF3040 domain-containing protein [Saccharothrix longispora]MDU0294250.1 DUF3040 domain-containing protein [Saccharothrix longispora]